MRDLLQQKAQQHQYLYHYTTFKILKLILTNQCFKFTHGKSSRLNDQHVQTEKGNNSVRECLYFACFTSREDESIAMWQIYGKGDSDVVRIQIPIENILKWIDAINSKEIPLISEYQQAARNSVKLQSCDLTDIAYVQGRKNTPMNIVWSNRCLYKDLSKIFDRNPLLTELLKNVAWDYEQETRIIIRYNEFNGELPITVPFTLDMLKSFKLMTGPHFKSFKQLKSFLAKIDCTTLWDSRDSKQTKYKSLFKSEEVNM